MLDEIAVLVKVLDDYLYLGVEVATLLIVSDDGFLRSVEYESFALCSRTNLGDIIETEHHIL